MVDINNLDYYDFSSNNYYTCLTDAECGRLYRIIEINNENIIKYDLLEGYQGGLSGLRQISNNYYYYGDNPKNFVAYNCKNDHECELWRIIGIVYDSQTNEYITKIIRNDSILLIMQGNSCLDNNTNAGLDSIISTIQDTVVLRHDTIWGLGPKPLPVKSIK